MNKKQLLKQMDVTSTVTNLSAGGKCSHCGSCCSNNIPLFKSDIDRISSYLKAHDIKPVIRGIALMDSFDNMCPFLNNKNECNIYSVRPRICRQWICSKKYSEMYGKLAKYGEIPETHNMRVTFFNLHY